MLAPGDPWIPADMEMPRRGAVPVRFFGTYNFCWIESQRALAPFTGADDEERTGRSKLKVSIFHLVRHQLPRFANRCGTDAVDDVSSNLSFDISGLTCRQKLLLPARECL